jgi:4-hydroxy-3-polyprenylbenzoate decarboxylase
MAYKSLQAYIERLEKEGELKRITYAVSPKLEISEIYDRVVKNNGPALLFENNGTEFPLAINLYGSEKRMLMSLDIDSFESVKKDMEAIANMLSSTKGITLSKMRKFLALKKILPKRISKKGSCQEIQMSEVDLEKLPVLTTWPYDGGPFFTLPCVHTVDPETKTPNIGMYRMQVFDKKTTGMHWHMHKGSAAHFEKYKKLKKRMPVTVTLGGDPVYTYAATAPLPENISEYILAGFLRKKKVRMVKSLTNEIYIPEDVDFVLEGYVDTEEDFVLEGPFGDHTGFYSLADYYPRFHITKITHKKNAIFPATVVGIPPQEDAFLGLATEKLFLQPLKLAFLPELLDIHLPMEGAFHNLVLVKIKKDYPGHAQKVMNTLWGTGQMMFSKVIIVFDEKVDLRDYDSLLKLFMKRLNIEKSISYNQGPLDVLDHSSEYFAYGSKLGIDVTDVNLLIQKPTDFAEIKQEEVFSSRVLENSLLLVSMKEDQTLEEIMKKWRENKFIEGIKLIIFFDKCVDLNRLHDVVWQCFGNIDPKRDFTSFNKEVLIVNAQTKHTQQENHQRDWPNVLVMDDETIKRVDTIWEDLNLGEFVKSPSLIYKDYITNNGAIKK